MNYVVVVLDPVPGDLSGVAAQVADGFRIPADRAVALLRRAPGPVTREVPERQARSVAEILRSAGLNVEIREGGSDGPAVSFSDAHSGAHVAEGRPAASEEPSDHDDRAVAEVEREPAHAFATGHGDEYQPAAGAAAERREDEGAAPAVAAAAVSPTTSSVRERATGAPPPGFTVPQPPRDPMKTTLTREPPALDRRSLRRRIATAATLPAILTLLVMLLALSVTLLPVLRAEQARRAGEIATAVAATIEGMSGGLPLSAPLTRIELQRVAESTRMAFAGRGVGFMAVFDADGSTLLEWDRTAATAGLTESSLRLARERAADADGTDVTVEPWLDSLRASWQGLLAIAGLADEPLVVAAAPVRRADVRLGTVAVAVDAAALRSALGQVLLTTLLVGLIPVLFAILAALSLTRGLTSAINYLLVAADRISHGDFQQSVELRRDDELGQIASAIDRMRISLDESMERLRRRR